MFRRLLSKLLRNIAINVIVAVIAPIPVLGTIAQIAAAVCS